MSSVPESVIGQPMNRRKRFMKGVMWNWLGAGAALFTAFILSPILIRKLGPDGYGVWALSFALVDYYWFLDFGFRSATVKYVAHYTATGERERVGEIISTSLLYAGMVAALILVVVGFSIRTVAKFFQVATVYQDQFVVLLFLSTIAWTAGVVFGLFEVSLNAIQRFDITSRIGVASTGLRAISQVALLYSGFGLIPLCVATVASQFLGYALNFFCFRRAFRNVKISYRLASRAALRQLGGFGIHSFLVTISTQIQSQSAPVLIGHFLPAAFAGYYNLPMRLVQYTVEFVSRIGVVTNSNAAELSAKGDSRILAQLAIYINRYSLVIFMPLAILLWTHGKEFFLLWAGPKMAPYSSEVLPILLGGYVIAIVGQFSSTMLLIGVGRHQRYARGMVLETVLGLVLLAVVIPRYGIVGAAWVGTSLMLANRGVYVSYLVSRTIEMNPFRYAHLVYTAPLLSAIPAFLILVLLKATMLPGQTWVQIAIAAAAAGVSYYLIAFFVCTEPSHRELIYGGIARQWSRVASSLS